MMIGDRPIHQQKADTLVSWRHGVSLVMSTAVSVLIYLALCSTLA